MAIILRTNTKLTLVSMSGFGMRLDSVFSKNQYKYDWFSWEMAFCRKEFGPILVPYSQNHVSHFSFQLIIWIFNSGVIFFKPSDSFGWATIKTNQKFQKLSSKPDGSGSERRCRPWIFLKKHILEHFFEPGSRLLGFFVVSGPHWLAYDQQQRKYQKTSLQTNLILMINLSENARFSLFVSPIFLFQKI
jgi:hypothetical protein